MSVQAATDSPRGISLRIFLADGTPDGLRIVEKSNWTGRAVMCSRAQYPQARQRDEFARPGVYILLGPSETDSGLPRVYIGEADVARARLDTHLRDKEFWTRLILFTSKDENLNKAHVRYLESNLIELARRAKRAVLENGNAPQPPALSEADIADAAAFLRDMLLIYPLLGVSAFEVVQEQPQGGPRLHLEGKDTHAEGRDTPEGFVVFGGSVARGDTVPSIHRYMVDLRHQLQESGVLQPGPAGLTLTQDYVFDSPSTAAGVMLGRSANGRVEWKDASGRTLRELQEASIGPAPGPA